MLVQQVPVDQVRPYGANPRKNDQAVAAVAKSIREFGFRQPIVVDEDMVILVGHTRLKAARRLGLATVPVHVAEGLTRAQKKAYRIADNRLNDLAEWNEELLAIELEDLKLDGYDVELTGFSETEMSRLLGDGATGIEGLTDPDAVPEAQAEAITKPGDVWLLGRHRLMCGDSTLSGDVERLLVGATVDLVCTDPPYCSGGFQENGKSSGSVGTSAKHKMVANDTLSTRGYSALLKSAFSLFGAQYLYAFTDWRMWIYLFDVSESSGFGVGSMIVWDKGTPGMGRGWRAQHELVLWGCKQTAPFDKHAPGVGNVLHGKRTGNFHHTTEKPVDVVAALLQNVPFVRTVADPFNGSGTTMIACEQVGKEYRGMEMDALYVDVAVRRWQQFTGKKATLEATGREFPG